MGLGPDNLVAALDAVLQCGRPVRALDLGRNDLRADGVALLASWLMRGGAPQLGELSLWDCQMGPQCGAHIGAILRTCPGLMRLNLGLNPLGDAGVAQFAPRNLQVASALEELVLWDVRLTQTGLTILTEHLLPPSRVRVLDVRANELGEGCEAVLLAFLARNTSLTQLFLADNPMMARLRPKDFAAAVGQCNFSVQSFLGGDGGWHTGKPPQQQQAASFSELMQSPTVDEKELAQVRALMDVGRRNRTVADALQDGSLALPFKALSHVPRVLLQPIGPGKRVTHLDLSHNHITELPAALVELECLTQLLLSHNGITDLSPAWSRLRSLTFVDVSHNAVSSIPSELAMVRLRHLLLSNNALSVVAPEVFHHAAPICASLHALDLSCNRITALPATLSNFRALRSLLLNNNPLTDVFAGLLKLFPTLETCNLSHCALEALPPLLSQYKERIAIAGNPFVQLPHEVVARGHASVWDYLEDMLHGHQMNTRMKLMFVGQGNVGKSTLLKLLRADGKVDVKDKAKALLTGAGVRRQTDGIEVHDWSPEKGLSFSTWDFAGQEVYYNTHQFFLSQRSLYVVVFSLMLSLEENNLMTWLNSLQVRAPGVSVLLVGTHADDKRCTTAHMADVSATLQSVMGKWERLYRREIRIRFARTGTDLCFFPIGATRQRSASGVLVLRGALLQTAREQPCLKEQVPNIYLALEEAVKRKRVDTPFVDLAAVVEWGVISDQRSLRRACRLLHDQGVIVSFLDDPASASGTSSERLSDTPQQAQQQQQQTQLSDQQQSNGTALGDLIILDPSWLTKFMTTIVGVNAAPRAQKAIVAAAQLPVIWGRYPTAMHAAFCRLLERFEVWVRLASGDFLVPCLLDTQPERNLFDSGARPEDHTVGRVYVIPFCPHGFFSHLLLRMWSFCRVQEYWSAGAVLQLAVDDAQPDAGATALVRVQTFATPENPFQSRIHILARGPNGTRLITKVVFTLHSFIQDWYDGLSDHITAHLPCVECLKHHEHRDVCHLFEANSFIKDYLGGGVDGAGGGAAETVRCPACKQQVRVRDMVPEIIGIVDGQGYAREVIEGRTLGVGGFASVLLGTWRGRTVAVKKLFLESAAMGVEGFTLKTFEAFAMEVDMMSRLSHANVVQLHAAYSRPPAIVMEYVPMGSLDGVLKGMAGPLDWPLIVRMALDVARGLEYLHGCTPRILHRDLKSPNILVNSLDVGDAVLLKVADLGLSCFDVGKSSGKMIENPRWVAPETLMHGLYTDKSDVFSYGIVLNEMVTRQLPFHEIAFNSEVEKRIKSGERPTKHVDTLDGYAKLVGECWAQDPLSRPTFPAIARRLVLVGEAHKMMESKAARVAAAAAAAAAASAAAAAAVTPVGARHE